MFILTVAVENRDEFHTMKLSFGIINGHNSENVTISVEVNTLKNNRKISAHFEIPHS